MEPRLCLAETELIKEVLSKNSNVCGKSWLQRQGTKHFIGKGLLMANGEDWYHQRHIVAPAFMGDKLKVTLPNITIIFKYIFKEKGKNSFLRDKHPNVSLIEILCYQFILLW